MAEPRGVFRPTTCSSCKAVMYSDTAWADGRVVLLDNLCRVCRG